MYLESKLSDSSMEIFKSRYYELEIADGLRVMSLHVQLAETEATCIWNVNSQIVVWRFLKVCIMSVE